MEGADMAEKFGRLSSAHQRIIGELINSLIEDW